MEKENLRCKFKTHNFIINVPCELDENNMLSLHKICDNDANPINIDMDFLINQDIERFKQLNKIEDERHQVNIESLEIRYIVITDEIKPQIRITYSFKQDDEFRRLCAGETASIEKGRDDKYTAISVYTKGCVVYW